MLRRGFWKGLLAGGLLGVAMSMMVTPQRKPSSTKRIMGKSKKMQVQAERLLNGVKAGMSSMMKD